VYLPGHRSPIWGAVPGHWVVSDPPDSGADFDHALGFGGAGVDGFWGASVQGPVWAVNVIDRGEPGQLGVELFDGVAEPIGTQPAFQGLVEPLNLALDT
jgi:hypothetical protein